MRGVRRFQLRVAVEERLGAVQRFHRHHLTEHLWPRTEKEFRDLAQEECLVEIVEFRPPPRFLRWLLKHDREVMVGLAYVATGSELDTGKERAEFGGIFIDESCRGLGLAAALGIVSISNYFVLNNPPAGRMIAHVHEFNELPRGVLQNQLGFAKIGQETPPKEVAPKSMKRNANGDVVGDLFQFDRATLATFATWIESFTGSLSGKGTTNSELEIAVPAFARNRAEVVEALRDLSAT